MSTKLCSNARSLAIDTGLAQVAFLTQPQNMTVVEGGDATFQCAAEENGMVLLFGWDYTPRVGMLTTVITGTTVAGVSMVTVSGDRTQLTLSGVQREVDGATVVCAALGSSERIPSNPATITVQCRYSYAVVKKLSKNSFFLFLFFFSVYYTHAGPSVYSRAEVNFKQY